MFDHEADKNNRRYSSSGDNSYSQNDQPTQAHQNPVTRRNEPVSIPDRTIPAPPAGSSIPAAAPPRNSAARRRSSSSVKSRDLAWVVIAVAVVAVVAVIGIVLTVIMSGGGSEFDQPMVTSAAALPTAVDARNRYQPSLLNGQQLTIQMADGTNIIARPWDGTARFNILLMGIDRRPWESGIGYRSDTMMLASLDPVTRQVGILSIPRDLYVPVPGYSQPQRINTALSLGELQREGYGPTLAMQTVQYNLGMGVHAYVVADFTALIKVVDAIGGIDVDVPVPIADYQFPNMDFGFDPLVLNAGLQHMDGYLAQKYARTRHGDSDFDRARRQQQVIFAIRDKVMSLSSLPQLIMQAPTLYGSVSNNVYTEMSLDQLIQLGLWLSEIDPANIHTGVIDQRYVSDMMTESGAAVLQLNTTALPNLLTEVFGTGYAQ